jgi:hypothetical protein
MIVEWGHSVVVGVAMWFFGLIPPNGELDPIVGHFATILDPLEAGLTGLGGWIPWSLLAVCAGVTFVVWGIAFVVRIVKSFLPTMSG